ncbi:hypothetical protein SLA_0535 [Streptomyces laurentii]|uniref:Uncharacterized protein n=1 Tax=Streptomyces laurentii TaxID=39478 RepID=A0A160NSX1_STRLU|nr:hypothetical protein SLA_0535 [Streptomyces laurentii]
MPAPAAMSRWSYACEAGAPLPAAYSSQAAGAAASFDPPSRTSVPYPRSRSTFTFGAVSGRKTVARTPCSRAAHAHASPALPPEAIVGGWDEVCGGEG